METTRRPPCGIHAGIQSVWKMGFHAADPPKIKSQNVTVLEPESNLTVLVEPPTTLPLPPPVEVGSLIR